MSSSGGYTGTGTKADLDNHSNQCNPSNRNYQGYDSSYSGTGTKADLGNHSNQCNPNNPNYQAQKKWLQLQEANWTENWLCIVYNTWNKNT